MLASSRQKVIDAVGSEDRVLDIGGWADPFARADWVIDLMPYATRGLYEQRGWVEPRTDEERFTADTWLVRDICDRTPYPFEDDFFDFVVCSHTLEDIRDPVWVCSEMSRIAKAGYIEVPSRLEEQTWGAHGGAAFVGWTHHHWLIDVADSDIEFVFKTHAVHGNPRWYFPQAFLDYLSEEERVQSLWWEGSFGFRERVIFEEREATDGYLGEFVANALSERGLVRDELEPRRQPPSLPRRAVDAVRARL